MSRTIALLVFSAACQGVLEGPPNPNGGPGSVTQALGPAPIRRMTRAEYNHTVRDLLGDTSSPADGFPPEEIALGFDNNADALGVTSLLAEQYLNAAEQLATTATQNLGQLVSCDPKAIGDQACATQFIAAFGKRAYRRPLATSEVAGLVALFTASATGTDFATGIRLVLEAMLQSPHFLYRVEFGDPASAQDPRFIPLGPYEIASRLSYLLLGSMPDAALFGAADAGQLGSPQEIEAQARRLFGDPRARGVVDDFYSQWLELNKPGGYQKDATVYPTFTPQIGPLAVAETSAFVENVVFDQSGDLETLLTASYSFLNAPLAQFYGVSGPAGSAFQRVALDPTRRAGLLTQASWLMVHSKTNQSSPVHRGKFVREKMLCQPLQPPPGNLNIVPPPLDPSLTTRQRFAAHSSNPFCASCHTLMDPIGLGFENYDALGLWRATDANQPIDASGQINGGTDIDGPFQGVTDLAHRLASSAQVRACSVTQWFRYSFGRVETAADAGALTGLQDQFVASKDRILELLVAIVRSDAFRTRLPVVPGGTP